MAEEKRKYKRIKGESLVRFKGDNFEIYSNLGDLGVGGLFLNTYYALEKGAKIDLSFELPSTKEMINARGKVVRQNHINKDSSDEETGLGIVFEYLEEQAREAIKNFAGE